MDKEALIGQIRNIIGGSRLVRAASGMNNVARKSIVSEATMNRARSNFRKNIRRPGVSVKSNWAFI